MLKLRPQALHVAGALALLRDPNYSTLAPLVSRLHPRRLEDVSGNLVELCRTAHGDDVKEMLQLPAAKEVSSIGRRVSSCSLKHAHTHTHSTNTTLQAGLSEDEVVRLLLQFQCNGFKSGLYLQLCIFNHSCSPNAVKLSPTEPGMPSVVRATRALLPGEEATISYLYPLEQSTAARLRALKQFGFVCECQICTKTFWDMWPAPKVAAPVVEWPDEKEEQEGSSRKKHKEEKKLEVQGCDDPDVSAASGLCLRCHPTKLTDDQVLERVASIEEEINTYSGPPPPKTKSQKKREKQKRAKQRKEQQANAETAGKAGDEDLSWAEQVVVEAETGADAEVAASIEGLPKEVAKATHLLDFATSWLADTRGMLHPTHMLTTRIHKLVVQACAEILQTQVPPEAFTEIGTRMLQSCCAVYQSMRLLAPPDHPDCGEVLCDIASMCRSLAAQDKAGLLKAFPHWQAQGLDPQELERACYKEHIRIKKLFEITK